MPRLFRKMQQQTTSNLGSKFSNRNFSLNMNESKQISVYDNDTSVFRSPEDKYTLVNFPLRTKMSTSLRSSSVGGSVIKSKHLTMRGNQPGQILTNLKQLKAARDQEEYEMANGGQSPIKFMQLNNKS